jgi:inorganic pyrophosphatase
MKISTNRAHPWHGVELGKECPNLLTAYIEIVPADTVKFEIDKESGLLSIDRPQKFSNHCPVLYGFFPKTYCSTAVVAEALKLNPTAQISEGDSDPLDVCVLSERTIAHGDILARVRPIGGLSFLDGGEVDDKIIAVLEGDSTYGDIKTIEEVPSRILDRISHYFLTYKLSPQNVSPNSVNNPCEIIASYGVEQAHAIIKASILDYQNLFSATSKIAANQG